MKIRIAIIAFLFAIVLYLLSFGPVLASFVLLIRFSGDDGLTSGARSFVVNTVYYPHLYAMAWSESYYNYINWWGKMIGKSIHGTHSDFRSRYIKD
jgi:hypothetical protein